MKKTTIIKLGGSVITYKDKPNFPLNYTEFKFSADEYIRKDVLNRLTMEIANATKENSTGFAVVNGAGPFGHQLVHAYLEGKKIAPVFIDYSVKHLNSNVLEYAKSHGLNLEPIHPISTFTCDEKNSYNPDVFCKIADMLKTNISSYGSIVPTVNYAGRLGNYEVISGDNLVNILAKNLNANNVIAVTDVDGIYDCNPKTNSSARMIKCVDASAIFIGDMNCIDVTSGICGKLEQLSPLSKKGVKCQIINGLVPGNLENAILGDESIGTIIPPN